MTRPIPELLAPAGSLDAVRAAVANGADSVYLGAERFNARDDGAQLTMDDLGEACRIAHAAGVRIYLTFNVLMKPAELREALLHLGECIDRGIDAAIVQDLGVVRLIQRVYPSLEIHGSTQMTVHDGAGARVLQEMGVERVVLARENTLDDLRAIRAAVPDLGLETFIHGALCIAYSGQCFMSGMISERSANRGACAQSCRKDYELRDHATRAELDRGYLISARDLAGGEHLDAIAEIGIGTLKIEGRKKKPEYVATATRTYRAFLDRVADGEWAPPSPEETQPLVQIFSRGFTGGMFGGRDGRHYVTRTQPDNRGLEVGEVVRIEGGEIVLSTTAPIQAGDGLGFVHPDGPAKGDAGFTVKRVRDLGERGERRLVAVPADARVGIGWTVLRSYEAALNERARASYQDVVAPAHRASLDVVVSGFLGAPLLATFTGEDDAVTVESAIRLDAAAKRPLDEARLREQLGRLGETPFVIGTLDASGLADGVFLPMSVLNDMRQEAVRHLLERRGAGTRAEHERRVRAIDAALPVTRLVAPDASDRSDAPNATDDGGRLSVEVFTVADAEAALAAGADEVSLDVFLRHPAPPPGRVQALAEAFRERGATLRLRTPSIVRPEDRPGVDRYLVLGTAIVSGHLGLVAELSAVGRDVVADYAVNCFNQHTAQEIFRLGARRIVLSVELTTEEMGEVAAPWGGRGFDVFAYGRPEGMTLEHCVLSAAFDREVTTCRDLCVQKHPDVRLTDPAGYVFPVATDSACRNRLLHSRPVDGSGYLPRLWALGLRSYRLVFNVPGDPVAEVTAAYRAVVDALGAGRRADLNAIREITGGEYTRGHFATAV